MTFYLAGPYSSRARLSQMAGVISGFSRWHCNARWLDGTHDGMDPQHAAIEDIQDVRAADALVIDARGQSTRGGMWVEAGIAIQAGKDVIVVAPEDRELNVFMYVANVYREKDFAQAARLLRDFERLS